MKLYNEEKNENEIRMFVQKYVESIRGNREDRYNKTLSLIPNGKGYILDYGCGWGHYAVALREKGYNVLAIDLSENEIEICKLVWGNQEGISFEKRSIESIADKKFDYVLSSQVIEHVHNPGFYLSQINRVLKSKGKLIISLPNIINPRFIIPLLDKDLNSRLKEHSKLIFEKYNKTHDHIQAWDPFHFVALCASVGFLLECYIPMEGTPFPFRKTFKPYVYFKNKRLQNFCYTMAFRFSKVKDVYIGLNE